MAPEPGPAPDPEAEALAALELEEARPARGRRRLLALALLAISAALLWFSWPRGSTGPSWTTVPAERGDLRVLVTAIGALEPLNQVDVGTEVSGTIRTVLVDFNDRVTRGEVLARLDTDELEAQVLQGRASLRAAEARVAQARATVHEATLKRERCAALAARELCSRDELDSFTAAELRARADEASASAQVEVARATLSAQETRLEKAAIRSPIDGLVLSRRIEPGQTVAASLQTPVLFVLAEDLTQMELHVDVDEADVGQVREGQAATFTVDAYPDRSFPARITQLRLAPEAEGGVVTYETVLAVTNDALLLRPGMTATADILVAETRDALLVPNAALRFRPPETATGEATGGGFFGRLLPGPPRRPRAPGDARANPDDGPARQLWVLRDGVPTVLAVRSSLDDGVRTEIVEGELRSGDPVIVGVARNDD
ncbi:MAG: efflux RND transporter periplasmic adaptor subunit [Pseudomonadales bacterium]|jgi:HlyD family secretion protein|nr:efflux RND transporter periplasmic adaptor subunit [Pseudomonadales bacterium]